MNNWHNYVDDRNLHTVVGTLKVRRGLRSPQLANRRDLYVYLPPSYNRGDQRYPVLYMHDGQNLFDHLISYVGEWQVDETMEALSQEGLEAIVVGIPNKGKRRLDE
jgi:predicted alpha/beta superfamily hydrolase